MGVAFPRRATSAGQGQGERMGQSMYESGEYLEGNPTWGVEDSPWKARQVLKMLSKHGLTPRSVCEVGCGAGEILSQLRQQMPDSVRFVGYEISPQAFEMCRQREADRLEFRLGDILEQDVSFDLLLVLDVIEHIPDIYGFLRGIKGKAEHKIFHIPLDMSAQVLLRGSPPGDDAAETGAHPFLYQGQRPGDAERRGV